MSHELPFADRVAEACARKVGSPYIWAAKGRFRVEQPSGRLVSMPEEAFDCSGLVTAAIFEAGGPDWRYTHNAQALFEQLGAPPSGQAGPCLAFFGGNGVHHVCLCLEGDVLGWVFEAAGGDETTLEPKDEARVYLHRGAFWGAAACLGRRALPSVP